LDAWVGDLVTVVEGIDLTDVAAQLGPLAVGILAESFARFAGQNGGQRLRETLGRERLNCLS
jgi:hypothetical protein